MELKNAILNNIIREVEAIRGYLIDPIEGDFINDEIKHIEQLCDKLRAACFGDRNAEIIDDLPGDDLPGDEVDESSYNPYIGQNEGPDYY